MSLIKSRYGTFEEILLHERNLVGSGTLKQLGLAYKSRSAGVDMREDEGATAPAALRASLHENAGANMRRRADTGGRGHP